MKYIIYKTITSKEKSCLPSSCPPSCPFRSEAEGQRRVCSREGAKKGKVMIKQVKVMKLFAMDISKTEVQTFSYCS